MSNPRVLLESIEATLKGAGDHVDPCSQWWVDELRAFINEHVKEMTPMVIGGKYSFEHTRRGKATRYVRAQVTKENGKTWVLYELSDSGVPGARWTYGKTGCTADSIQRISTDAAIPPHVVLK